MGIPTTQLGSPSGKEYLEKGKKITTRSFSVDTSEDPSTLVDRSKRVAVENNATLEGDASSGGFSGRGVEGVYPHVRDRFDLFTDTPFSSAIRF